MELIDRYHSAMARLANVYVRDRAVAQDVVQDTWLGVLRGLDGGCCGASIGLRPALASKPGSSKFW